jgi:hypothetical protein
MANQIKDRTLVDDRVTFDYSTPNYDVVARPTDPYVTPGHSSAGQLVTALQAFQSGIQSYAEYRQYQNEKDREEGALERAKTEETPKEKKTRAFIEGWEKLDGEIKAKQDYRKAVDEYISQNNHLDPEEFNAGLDGLSKEYMSGTTKNFLKGFLPAALDIETKAKTSYNQFQNQKVREELVAKTTTVLKTDISNIVAQTNGMKSSLEDIYSDPRLYLSLVDNPTYSQELSTKLRNYLDDKFKDYKSMGLSTKDISALMLNTVGQMAKTYAMPELLDYVDLKDKKGFAVSDDPTLSKEVFKFKEEAKNEQLQHINRLENLQEQNTKLLFSTTVNAYAAKLFSLNPEANPKDAIIARDLFNQMTNNEIIMGSMDTGTVSSLLRLAESRFNYEIPDEKKDQTYLTPIYQKYMQGTLTQGDLLFALSRLSPGGQSKVKGLYDDITKSPTQSSLKMNEVDTKWYSQMMQSVTSYATFNMKTAQQPTYIAEMGSLIMEKYLEVKRKKGSVDYKDREEIRKEIDGLIMPLKTISPSSSPVPSLSPIPSSSPKPTKTDSTASTKPTKNQVYDPATGQLVEVGE